MKTTKLFKADDAVIKTNDAMPSELLKEKAILEYLHHPRIVPAKSSTQYKTQVILLTPFYHQGTLSNLLHKHPQGLAPHAAAMITIEILEGLSYVFSTGLVVAHRDIKPANIFLSPGNHAQLGDFGSALLASQKEEESSKIAAFVGSLTYAAPEQICNAQLADIRSDIYACGLVFWECLAGTHCFKGKSSQEIVSLKLHNKEKLENLGRPLPASLSPEQTQRARAIITCACNPDPTQRFQNPQEFIAALEASGLLTKREQRARRAIKKAKEKSPFLRWAPVSLAAGMLLLCSLWASVLLCLGS